MRLGSPDSVTISSGVTSTLTSGQSLADVTILSGGYLIASAGSVADQITISNGGTAAADGGLLEGVTADSGGYGYVFSGVLSGATVNADGQIVTYDGGEELAASIAGYGANDVLENGAKGSGFFVSSGGRLSVHPFASASDVVVSSGALLVDWLATSGSGWTSGAISNLSILSGGHEALAYEILGRTVSGLEVTSDGFVYAYGGAVLVSTVLQAGMTSGPGSSLNGLAAEGYVYSGAVASRTVIKSGAEQFVYSGGLASGALISKGGFENVSFGGVSISAQVLDGGKEFVYSAGESEDATVSKGGVLALGSAGVLAGDTVQSGGDFDLVGGANVSGVVLSARVVQTATAISGATLASGAIVDLFDQTVVGGGGIVVGSGALASGTAVAFGGTETVLAHGIASATLVETGGALVVSSGAAASGGTVASGGLDTLWIGGKEKAITVSAGGVLEANFRMPPGHKVEVSATETISGVTLLSGAFIEALPTGDVAGLAQAIAAHAPAVAAASREAPDSRDTRSPLAGALVAFATSSVA